MTGSVPIGVLITEVVRPHRLVRPFLGVGVFGGYTTFSTYAVEALVSSRPAGRCSRWATSWRRRSSRSPGARPGSAWRGRWRGRSGRGRDAGR
ncbi:FluC/FEX family fluoride channel [Pseudonocardia nigra]|uniref:FluC/FEX family fluoride channel n=1 Tax=Pseudonocardia nigra TaxID=1921578 RepID=UPI003557A8BE